MGGKNWKNSTSSRATLTHRSGSQKARPVLAPPGERGGGCLIDELVMKRKVSVKKKFGLIEKGTFCRGG